MAVNDLMKMAELVYDKLANNTSYERFNPQEAEDMRLYYDDKTPVIAILKDGAEYILKFERNEKGSFKVFE